MAASALWYATSIWAGGWDATLAEGCGRNGDAGFARFGSIAMGSASELEYHLLLAKDLKLIQPKDHAELSQRRPSLSDADRAASKAEG